MKQVQWIKAPVATGYAAVCFIKKFTVGEGLVHAVLKVSAMGIYVAEINGEKIGRQVLVPGWTNYDYRVQYATEDITAQMGRENTLSISVGPGWAVGRMGYHGDRQLYSNEVHAVCELTLTYADGRKENLTTGEDWEVFTHEVTFSDIYDGETVDKTHEPKLLGNAVCVGEKFPLILQVGEDITEQERFAPVELIITPKGERVIDFGQNLAGYVELKIKGKRGDRVVLSFAEVLDKDGNFYKENYRSAKNIVTYICSGNEDVFKPRFSFQGYRYIRLDEYPFDTVELDGFRSVAVSSALTRTGRFACGDAKINQLYHNIIWGQKSNYLDIPTDCPQRDERLGWTGDTQVFCRTAALNFDVRKFFEKWLGDLRLEQKSDGAVLGICPEKFKGNYKTRTSAGWGDVATIVPWTLYEIYGDKKILEENFELMRRWVEYIRHAGGEEYLWLGGYHYGDWLAMDAGGDTYVGATSNDLIGTAFYAHSVDLLVRAGEVLGRDMSEYRSLHQKVKDAFRAYFMENGMPKEELPLTEVVQAGKSSSDFLRKGITQTSLVLILHFGLCLEEERAALGKKLCELIRDFGNRMSTGFLGTPYLLHVLSSIGRQDLAYELFFAEGNPSWLYSVNHGATTMWEHWNSLKEDGSFWSTDMNSFNHYSYGAVGDWIYGEICGIKIAEGGAGYRKLLLTPHPIRRLSFAKCALDTVQGRVESHWYYAGDRVNFEFTVPEGSEATICLPDGKRETVTGGSYYYSVKALD
ncbi:MAG: family 78 glycoside hydrolase catalytic domain [Clostridia bacterium]|nr:family 78 glycoside hydrolase catalytic domain [Clostridia bacterium]